MGALPIIAAPLVRGVYNSAEYLKQRRAMLQAFADWLLKCKSS